VPVNRGVMGIDERDRPGARLTQQVVDKRATHARRFGTGTDQRYMLRRKKRVKILNRHLIFPDGESGVSPCSTVYCAVRQKHDKALPHLAANAYW
jgi:hypothetical protein